MKKSMHVTIQFNLKCFFFPKLFSTSVSTFKLHAHKKEINGTASFYATQINKKLQFKNSSTFIAPYRYAGRSNNSNPASQLQPCECA